MRVLALAAVLAACGPSNRNNGDDTPDAMSECPQEGMHRCTGATYEVCTGGTWTTNADCPVGCVDSLGCVECTPGQTYCKDGNVFSCGDDGHPGAQVQECSGATVCVDGACADACADAAVNKSYIGCEYWAVDLDNAVDITGTPFFGTCLNGGVVSTQMVCLKGNTIAGLCDPPANGCPSGYSCTSQSVCILSAQTSPFAVVVSNPQSRDAHVVLIGPGNEMITRTIAAGQVSAILPQMANAIPDQSVDGTLKAKKAYKLTSDLPIVAYQFNPLDNVNVFSNDASLLLPRTAFDTDYYAMSYPTLDRRTPPPGSTNYVGAHNFYGYLTVIAWQDGTQVEVTPTTAVQASATQQTIAAGVPTTFTLDAFEVLQLEAAAAPAPGGDLTGTHITSPNMMTFGVFGGHEATIFGETTPPDTSHTRLCCADHLEEMMFPSSTWGKEFAIARSQKRTNEPDMLRIIAQKDGTMVTFSPTVSAGTCPTLAKGGFCEVKIQEDTEITSTEPILVGHYLEASIWQGTTSNVGEGDPSMAIAVPSEQFRKEYTILVPSQYAKNYVSIAAAATGGVQVDGTAVASMTTFGTHRAARVPLTAGAHKITCADGCGITVYGYSDAVSYMFAGGLDLKQIVIF